MSVKYSISQLSRYTLKLRKTTNSIRSLGKKKDCESTEKSKSSIYTIYTVYHLYYKRQSTDLSGEIIAIASRERIAYIQRDSTALLPYCTKGPLFDGHIIPIHRVYLAYPAHSVPAGPTPARV